MLGTKCNISKFLIKLGGIYLINILVTVHIILFKNQLRYENCNYGPYLT